MGRERGSNVGALVAMRRHGLARRRRSEFLALGATLALVSAGCVGLVNARQASADGGTYYGAPGTYTYTVPLGTSALSVDVRGSVGGGNGGRGASVQATIPVVGGEQLTVDVGGPGYYGFYAGAPGAGGTACCGGNPLNGYSGGGSSDILRGVPLVVAGGGGGGGGGVSGCCYQPGYGGDAGFTGNPGGHGVGSYAGGGGGGGQTVGGTGGGGSSYTSTGAPSTGQSGGAGGTGSYAGGGGGGGGYFGGGGGGGDDYSSAVGGGGGGGSSFVEQQATDVSYGYSWGSGNVLLTPVATTVPTPVPTSIPTSVPPTLPPTQGSSGSHQGGCFLTVYSQDPLTPPNYYEGVLGVSVATTDSNVPPAPTAATVTCSLTINAMEQNPSTELVVAGSGVEVDQQQTTFYALPGDTVQLCTTVHYTALAGATDDSSCDASIEVQSPPQPVIDAP